MTAEEIPKIIDFRPFVVCTPDNYGPTRAFFLDLGFEILWEGEDICEFATGFGSQRFLLSQHILESPANPGMLHFWVESVDDWYSFIGKLEGKSSEYQFKVAEPVVAEWGWRIMYVWAPSGLLLHFAEPHSAENIEFFSSATWMKDPN